MRPERYDGIAILFHWLIAVLIVINIGLAWSLGSFDRHDPVRDHVAGIVEACDWLGRYRLEPAKGAPLTVVDRDGEELRGVRAAACILAK